MLYIFVARISSVNTTTFSEPTWRATVSIFFSSSPSFCFQKIRTCIALQLQYRWCATPERCQFSKIIFVYYLLCATAPTTTSTCAREKKTNTNNKPSNGSMCVIWSVCPSPVQHFRSQLCSFFLSFHRSQAFLFEVCAHTKPSNHTVSEPTHVCLVVHRPKYTHMDTVSMPKKCIFQK